MAADDETPIDMFSTLPEEISTDIFTRITAKSVGKFRCLSKTWNTRLSTPDFINSHLSRNTHQKSLILLSQPASIHLIKLPIENPTISKELLELELENNKWTKVVGSCNGLVLLLNRQQEMFLVNPTTVDVFKLPNLDIPSEQKKLGTFHGFGYDSSNDDYKILVLTVFPSNEPEPNHFPYTIVNLYSVKSGVWRRINDYFTDYSICGCSCGAYTNGSIHWVVDRMSSVSTSFVILAFDLATEVFNEIEIPPKQYMFARDISWRIFSHEGCLCTMEPLGIQNTMSSEKIDVLMMSEYGMLNSWTKLGCVNKRPKWDMCVPLCFSRDGEILLVTREYVYDNDRRADGIPIIRITYNHTVVVYNLQDGTVKDMVVNGVPASFGDGISYVDSLVSPKVIASSS